MERRTTKVINDKGAFYLLIIDTGEVLLNNSYDNAESARKAAQEDAEAFPERTRRLFKMLPGVDPIEVMW
jgi:hypothetical protein